MGLEQTILSACNLAPDLVWVDPVLFAEEWEKKEGLGGCFAGLAGEVRKNRLHRLKGKRFVEDKKPEEEESVEEEKFVEEEAFVEEELAEADLAEEVIRLILRKELLLKDRSDCSGWVSIQTKTLQRSKTPKLRETSKVSGITELSGTSKLAETLDMLLRCRNMAFPLIGWFRENARILRWRSEPKPYYVWISEIMLQQTRVEAVKGYFDRFVESLPDIQSLADCPEEKLLKLWEGLGYYNRVRNLQKAARVVIEEYEGKLPDSYAKLQKLPGIGSYTAGAIASIAYGMPAPAVDGNVLRVCKRLTGSRDDITKPAVKKEAELLFGSLAEWVKEAGESPGDLNQALMELGATVCLPNGKPSCENCPVESLCRTAGTEDWKEIPVKPAKKSRKIEERTVFVIVQGTTDMVTKKTKKKEKQEKQEKKIFLEKGEKVGICKRPEKGLLAGLWELPNLEGKLSAKEAGERLEEELGIEPIEILELGEAKHIFSHVEWRMTGYAVKVAEYADIRLPIQMVTKEELEQEYSLPSAFEAYRPEREEV